MPLTLTMTIRRSLKTGASGTAVFRLLSDIARSASFFPKIDTISDLGCNTWRFETERIGIGSYTILQLSVISRYQFDKEQGIISWAPAGAAEHLKVEGHWEILQHPDGCHILLTAQGTHEINLPEFMKNLLAPLIRLEAEILVNCFLDNLKKKLEEEKS